jgi:hypothetical protein
MGKKAKRWQVALVFGILGALVVAYALTWIPTTIDDTLPGMQFRLNAPHEEEERSISLKGKLYTPLFRDPFFEGMILPDGYPTIVDAQMRKIIFEENERGLWEGKIGYSIGFNIASLGAIYLHPEDKGMRRFCIALWETTSPDDLTAVHTDLYFSAPAATLEEAMALQAEFHAGEGLTTGNEKKADDENAQ